MSRVLDGFASILIGAATAAAAEPAFERFDLPNGAHVVMLHVSDAPKQATYTFLPLTIANDEAHRAQWSHLTEHMLIRSTDPVALQAEGIQINGETTHTYLRLETFAEPAKWRDSLDRHAKWVTARTFDAEVLEREKGNIAGEEQFTSQRGFTSKFALAAWNQIVLHGLEHAAVHGDVAGATIEDVQAYVASRVVVNQTMTIATIGPTPTQDVKAEIEKLFGGLKSGGEKSQTAPDAAKIAELNREFSGTWDLPTRHLMWFWKLPDDSIPIKAAATGLAGALQIQLFHMRAADPTIRSPMAYPWVETPAGGAFVIDLCVTDSADARVLKKKTLAALRKLLEQKQPSFALSQTARMQIDQIRPVGGINAIRAQMQPQMKNLAEGAWLLMVMNQEYAWRTSEDRICDALSALDAAALDALTTALADNSVGSLSLQPKKP